MSDSLQPYRLQHARLPCPSLSPRICSDLCPLSRWCHQTISSSVALFSYPLTFPKSGSFPRSWVCPLFLFSDFPKSGSFPRSWLFPSGGQSIEASASASALPMNIQGWFPFRIDWFDLVVRGTLKSSPAPQFKSVSSLALNLLYGPALTSIHDYMNLCCQSDVSAF